MYCNPPGSSVHGISHARILEWIAISSSKGSSPPRLEPMSLAWQADSSTTEPPWKPPFTIRIVVQSPSRPDSLRPQDCLWPGLPVRNVYSCPRRIDKGENFVTTIDFGETSSFHPITWPWVIGTNPLGSDRLDHSCENWKCHRSHDQRIPQGTSDLQKEAPEECSLQCYPKWAQIEKTTYMPIRLDWSGRMWTVHHSLPKGLKPSARKISWGVGGGRAEITQNHHAEWWRSLGVEVAGWGQIPGPDDQLHPFVQVTSSLWASVSLTVNYGQ